jgi:hypothetical protein
MSIREADASPILMRPPGDVAAVAGSQRTAACRLNPGIRARLAVPCGSWGENCRHFSGTRRPQKSNRSSRCQT